jgi:hypothetical protein
MASKIETFISDWGRIPYSLALSTVRMGVARLPKGSRVWPRNSFLTLAFRPFKSDLDLTIWFETQPGPQAIAHLQWLLKLNKLVFPILGESNVYVRSSAGLMAGLINRYELARDPELEWMLKEDLTKKSAGSKPFKRVTTERAEKCIFLLRMLDADFHNLLAAPGKRRKKWQVHLTSVGLNEIDIHRVITNENPIRKILETAFGFFEDYEFQMDASDEVENFLRNRSNGVPDHQANLTPKLLAIFPHRLCFVKAPKKLSGQVCKEIFTAQVAWEIWGITGQSLLLRQTNAFLDHLALLKKFLPAMAGKALIDFDIALDEILSDLKSRDRISTPVAAAKTRRKIQSKTQPKIQRRAKPRKTPAP